MRPSARIAVWAFAVLALIAESYAYYDVLRRHMSAKAVPSQPNVAQRHAADDSKDFNLARTARKRARLSP